MAMVYRHGVRCVDGVRTIYSLGAISELCCRISGGKTWDMELRVGAQKYIDRWGKGHDWAWA
jgi:hypothetical protein